MTDRYRKIAVREGPGRNRVYNHTPAIYAYGERCARAAANDERQKAFDSLRNAVNEVCGCGGSGPGESDCNACEIWHHFKKLYGEEP